MTCKNFRRWAVAAAACLASGSAEAKFAPDADWQALHSAHFRVYAPHEAVAFGKTVAGWLEEAFAVLTVDLRWVPSAPIDVVVRTDTDEANGVTSVFPQNRIVINAVPFAAGGPDGEYDDWVRAIAYHELTHLIANDSTSGLFSLLRFFAGSSAKVNPYQPMWLVEGLAVYEETAHGAVGRGRSVFYDMMIRAAAGGGALDEGGARGLGVTLDRLSDGPPVWPGPMAAYLYGYEMEDEVARTGGARAPGLISIANSGRIPFFIDWPWGPAVRVTGQGYGALWRRAVARMKSRAQEELARVHAAGATVSETLVRAGRLSGGFAAIDSGGERGTYFIRDSYEQGQGLSFAGPDGRTGKLSDWRYGGGRELRRLGPWLLYSRLDQVDTYRLYSDAYLWDTRTGSEAQLTQGARALDPDASPDFDWRDGAIRAGAIAYVKILGDGNEALAIWNGREERILYRGARFARLAFPAYSRVASGPTAGWVAFTLKENGGPERLVAVNSASGRLRELTPALRAPSAVATTPSWDGEGVLFAGNLDGGYDVYRAPWKGGAPERLTRLETGALFPQRGQGGELLGMAYGAGGFDVARLGARDLGAAVQKNDPAPKAPAPASDVARPSGYSVLPALWPKYWLPFGARVADGWLLGVSTSGGDALQLHQYWASVTWDTRASFPLYDLSYQYDGFFPSIKLERAQQNNYVGLLLSSNRVATTSLAVTYPLDLWSLAFGGNVVESSFQGAGGATGGLQFRLSHGDLLSYPDSIDAGVGEKGHRADLILNAFFLGDDQFTSAQFRWEQRIPLFWPQHFLRLFVDAIHSSNGSLSEYYQVGGGESTIGDFQDFLVRGYAPGAVYGRDLATLNVEYWLPLIDIFRGVGVWPLFYERAKLKLFADAGSGEVVNGAVSHFGQWPVGVGAQLLQDVKLLYRVPLTLAVGFDYGLFPGLGGEAQFVVGAFTRLGP